MIRFFLNRPIAVLLSFTAAVIFSLLAYFQLPVSLLPEVEVPRIIVKVDYTGASPAQLEQNVMKPIRENMLTLKGLKDIKSTANSEQGMVELQFEYGTAMNLAYIEANEKIDRLTDQLPDDIPRPRVVRINTSDIPVVRLQVLPKNERDYLQVSELTEKVIRKRIEQLPGVSLVDINGSRNRIVSITPNEQRLRAFGLSSAIIYEAIRNNNTQLGGINVRDGHYTYYLKISSKLKDAEGIKDISVQTPGGAIVKMHELAEIKNEQAPAYGYHFFSKGEGAQEGLVVTIHKQANAKMTDLMPEIIKAVDLFKTDYPQVSFFLTQDQSLLLRAGINNLTSSLMWGGLFAFAVLFLFMGNYRTAFIIGISLPISLIISFSLFWLFDISINIISLSGLALGIGMLIDNAIIVLDNITRLRSEGVDLIAACVEGVKEVIAPLISSMLTTLAVFIPLIFLHGLSGALFYDQAVAIAAILSVSLAVSFILLPLLYRMVERKSQKQQKEDSRIYLVVKTVYKTGYNFIWRHKGISFIILLLMTPLLFGLINIMDQRGLPEIEKNESLITVQWNEPLDAAQNYARINALINTISQDFLNAEGDVGLQQYLMQKEEQQTDEAIIYLTHIDTDQKEEAQKQLQNILKVKYPNASWQITDTPNAFDQLFSSGEPYLEVQLKDYNADRPLSPDRLQEWQSNINAGISITPGQGTALETAVLLHINNEKLQRYQVENTAVKQLLQQMFSTYTIDDIKSYGNTLPIRVNESGDDFSTRLNGTFVQNKEGKYYPLANFLDFEFQQDFTSIVAGRTGIYQGFEIERGINPEEVMAQIRKASLTSGTNVQFEGQYFKDQENLKQLLIILAISVLLLYFILAAQFESLVQPFIIMLTLPLGVAGSLLLLWIAGATVNIMSLIGIIVTLGIMVNDSILKVDTINRLCKDYKATLKDNQVLLSAIARAGEMRLKPILMTSATTILALLPILFTSGIGADLQRPLVLSVIGGLTIGTLLAIYFVPLAYWFFSRGILRKQAI